MSPGLTLLPPAGSAAARGTDALFLTLVGLSVLLTALFVGLIVIFSYRYRRGAKINRDHPPSHARGLEAAWTIAPLLLFLVLFAWAARDYALQARAPKDAVQIFVVAKQWMWKAEQPDGRREINELHIPINTPIKLIMTSQDVIHSLFIPAFRNKRDVVPGRYSMIWFQADRPGEYLLLCAEYCGTDHSEMKGRVVAMQPQDYARWLADGATHPGLAQRGFTLFREHGCMGCHAAASTVHAPELSGLLGRRVHLSDGRDLIADENYVHDSMMEPQKDVVAGYEPIMPSFKGQLDEEEIMAIMEYIRSLDPKNLTGARR
ncbi:cytochrome c oxidase subunit II [Parapusillimonas sp. SGNA-6]|nr:cytochrome c oxidase subunit II [Parapusillimonas sp. SGNA-6]